MTLFDKAVTRLRGTPVEDPYSGEETDTDWSAPDRLLIPQAEVQPLQGQMDPALTFDRETVTTRYWLYAPGAPDVLDTDRLEYAGEVYEIDGDVQRWVGGRLSHLQAMLKKVRG